MTFTAALGSVALAPTYLHAARLDCYTRKSLIPRASGWSGGTGRSAGLKIPRPSLAMWVRPPPPAPNCFQSRQTSRSPTWGGDLENPATAEAGRQEPQLLADDSQHRAHPWKLRVSYLQQAREASVFRHLLVGKQPWHPARSQNGRKGEAQRRAGAFGSQHFLLQQGRDDAPALPFTRAGNGAGVAARQFAAIKQRFENGTGLGRQLAQPDFLFRPDQNTGTEALGLDEALHEIHLVDAHVQEKPREFRERFLAQGSTAVEIVAARQIAVREQPLVVVYTASEAAR